MCVWGAVLVEAHINLRCWSSEYLLSSFSFVCVCWGVGWVCVHVVVTSSVTLYHISEIETLTQPGAHLARLAGQQGPGMFILPPFLLWHHRHKLQNLDLNNSKK